MSTQWTCLLCISATPALAPPLGPTPAGASKTRQPALESSAAAWAFATKPRSFVSWMATMSAWPASCAAIRRKVPQAETLAVASLRTSPWHLPRLFRPALGLGGRHPPSRSSPQGSPEHSTRLSCTPSPPPSPPQAARSADMRPPLPSSTRMFPMLVPAPLPDGCPTTPGNPPTALPRAPQRIDSSTNRCITTLIPTRLPSAPAGRQPPR